MEIHKQILLIEDDNALRHDTEVALQFLGEIVDSSTYTSWQAQFRSLDINADDVAVILLGSSALPLDWPSLLKELNSLFEYSPIILLGHDSDKVRAQCNLAQSRRIISALDNPINHLTMLNALHQAQRYNQAMTLSKKGSDKRPVHLFRSLVGSSREMESVRSMMGQVADTDVTVLICGESGTGKEVVARNLHFNSSRRKNNFVPVNCGAIPAELLESELFGHEKGAFTGAISSRPGRFEMAQGGTLFLDEIGDMPLQMQVKLLRVLQEKTYERVGGNKTHTTDVRIIAATHRHLEDMITNGSFREDLYYRLNVFPLEVPSLKDRGEDIPLLINEIVSRLESENRGSVRFNSASIMSLCHHTWPGNVRELANLVERMAILHPNDVVGVHDLPDKYRQVDIENETEHETEGHYPPTSTQSVVGINDAPVLPERGIDLKVYITELEQSLIQQALDGSNGVVARAAECLAIRRTTLVEKMRKYGIQR